MNVTEVSVFVLVEPGFVPTELSLVQDVLRISNRLSQTIVFHIQYCTTCDESLVEGLGGLLVKAKSIREMQNEMPNHFVVLGGANIHKNFEKLRLWIRHYEHKGCEILLLSDTASEWKNLNPSDLDVTTHWENHQLSRDINQLDSMNLPLYSKSHRVISAAGMMATADVALNAIVAPHSIALAHAVSRVLLMHTIRTPDIHQPRSENDNTYLQKAGLERVVQLMEENLEVPLRVSVLAELSGCSVRQLERRFQKVVGCNPVAFYRSLRLKRGKALLHQTNMSIIDIAISLGFSSSSSFSRLYESEYGITPARVRALLKRTAPHK
ncbi:GlxA family transcriptional regulator [Marinomonas sp. GJ51-6]|uniref:GlxA family transcriptional regulator n=1 Tax=Marinomonas sp. GJ51-6 TaxID=2992802 RepID=UPI0029344109|nr:helix-turn-helix domain-containing protein [Marinomonas sp. GJ51-6]WOD07619.1 helix-turn-helix domain-containing protein [Marinomonas sp. GJ51-6]